jgi:hypothetical protein
MQSLRPITYLKATAATGGALLLVLLSLVASAQQPNAERTDRNTLICSSTSGSRTYCDADTSRGVRRVRQIGDVRCIEGYTWGFDEKGVWVDRGCRAEFALPAERRAWNRRTQIEAGTVIAVRSDEPIDASDASGRIYTGTVDADVTGSNGQLAIPRGATVELISRVLGSNEMVIDLESVVVNSQRYAIQTDPQRVTTKEGVGANERTGRYVGGGAAIGAIIGAIAGGGKGAAIGAGAGAAAGAGGQIVTRGRSLKIPAESLLTFRVERALTVGVADTGTLREGSHYHENR